MRRIFTAALTAFTLIAVLVAITGCTRVRLQDDASTKTSTEAHSIPLQGATSLRVNVRQGVGDLTMRASSATTDVVQTVFTFAPASWRPELSSSVEASAASLRIAQPSSSGAPIFSDVRNSWVITLPKGVATDLSLQLGVGTSDVDLRGIDLTNLNALTGVGDTTIDLSGPRTTDLAAHIEAGVGRLTVRVPRTIGVRVTGRQDGVGHFTADGFVAEGNTWVNPAYSAAGPKIVIDLVRGVGDVTLVMVD
jgi:hypothetical protein